MIDKWPGLLLPLWLALLIEPTKENNKPINILEKRIKIDTIKNKSKIDSFLVIKIENK
jgi:hypothetical protein